MDFLSNYLVSVLIGLVLLTSGCAHICHGRFDTETLKSGSPADRLFCSRVP